MKRVLFVSTSTTLGGAEKTLYTLATLLEPRRFQVAGVVSLKPFGVYAEKLSAAGFATFSLGLQGPPGLGDFQALSRIIRETKPDLVHALMFQAIEMSRLVKLGGAGPFKLVSSPRVNYRTRSLWTRLLDRGLKGADDLLIPESKASRDYLAGPMGYRPEKLRTIYNGVDAASWAPSALERRQKRLELRVGSDEVLLGTAGRLDEQKGQAVLIDALARLQDLPLRCVILGEGPERTRLEAQIRRLGLEGRVILAGERPDLPAWFSAMDIFALPSLWEGLPNSVLEAMAAGLPVVASRVDGVAEIIQDTRNGALVSPGNAPTLAGKIAELCRDPRERARLSGAAKETAAERFSLLNMMSAYEDAYASVLKAW